MVETGKESARPADVPNARKATVLVRIWVFLRKDGQFTNLAQKR